MLDDTPRIDSTEAPFSTRQRPGWIRAVRIQNSAEARRRWQVHTASQLLGELYFLDNWKPRITSPLPHALDPPSRLPCLSTACLLPISPEPLLRPVPLTGRRDHERPLERAF